MTALPAIKDASYFDALDAASYLDSRYGEGTPQKVIDGALKYFGRRFALVSSFGSESAVLLHLAAEVSKDIPVLFLDTGKLFGETRRFRDELTDKLGLTDVRTIKPDENDLHTNDPKGNLWVSDTNKCCYFRKVVPLDSALQGFEGWASGRKRFQGGVRSLLPHFEASDGRVKVNPMAFWNKEDVTAYIEKHGLPRHPLVEQGFASIGCMPCTEPVSEGESDRAGRWKGQNKTECGIHLSLAENSRVLSGN
ncbi:phosphoadenylyl-sulfate reductase [Kordiimonas laminariae]|uniref:phosphoadenylyl-sulfate reductase n=1 Tax=Kordiimonas laminariae TaxID=2917717 RepID=UPI001FF60067|nr:phosphoadenylyl-sulfate reductase [Kordiimonas laminariae]MCK0069068.1 phosphoadenylyl-sulfate reductase [Kordiimonas laminariae]